MVWVSETAIEHVSWKDHSVVLPRCEHESSERECPFVRELCEGSYSVKSRIHVALKRHQQRRNGPKQHTLCNISWQNTTTPKNEAMFEFARGAATRYGLKADECSGHCLGVEWVVKLLGLIYSVDGASMCSVLERSTTLDSFLSSDLIRAYYPSRGDFNFRGHYRGRWFDLVLASGFTSETKNQRGEKETHTQTRGRGWVTLFDQAVNIATKQPKQRNGTYKRVEITVPQQLEMIWNEMKKTMVFLSKTTITRQTRFKYIMMSKAFLVLGRFLWQMGGVGKKDGYRTSESTRDLEVQVFDKSLRRYGGRVAVHGSSVVRRSLVCEVVVNGFGWVFCIPPHFGGRFASLLCVAANKVFLSPTHNEIQQHVPTSALSQHQMLSLLLYTGSAVAADLRFEQMNVNVLF